LVGATILFVASPRVWYFGAGAGIVGVLGAIAVLAFPYRIGRIKTWLDPWADPTGTGFQTIQSLYAVASGGLFGLGLGQSRQKTFIPEAYNDIIFAIICEELGLVGAALVIILFAVLIWRGIKIAMNAKDPFRMYVATGITAVFAFQSIINIGVVTNTIPNTGQPLPFVSYGGTSLLFLMGMVGILLNISRYPKERD
jgi:cell division protein FtsW